MTTGERLLVFLGVWIALFLLGLVGHSRAPVKIKLRWYPRFVVVAGVLFVGLTYWANGLPESLYFSVPAAALFAFLNIKLTKFCPRCGYRNLAWGRTVEHCHVRAKPTGERSARDIAWRGVSRHSLEFAHG